MKLARDGTDAFALRLTAAELSAIIAAVRIAADVLETDDRAPPAAAARLRALLADYDRAAGTVT